MRERLKDSKNADNRMRITPAYAGKTSRQVFFWRLLKDHPRVCGKDYRLLQLSLKVLGSPPRMRERHSGDWAQVIQYGITPAYAGKTISLPHSSRSARDHPRVCGKDSWAVLSPTRRRGSPPRMRERPFAQCTHKTHIRITPAYAGKTLMARDVAILLEDHPRVCGKDSQSRS